MKSQCQQVCCASQPGRLSLFNTHTQTLFFPQASHFCHSWLACLFIISSLQKLHSLTIHLHIDCLVDFNIAPARPDQTSHRRPICYIQMGRKEKRLSFSPFLLPPSRHLPRICRQLNRIDSILCRFQNCLLFFGCLWHWRPQQTLFSLLCYSHSPQFSLDTYLRVYFSFSWTFQRWAHKATKYRRTLLTEGKVSNGSSSSSQADTFSAAAGAWPYSYSVHFISLSSEVRYNRWLILFAAEPQVKQWKLGPAKLATYLTCARSLSHLLLRCVLSEFSRRSLVRSLVWVCVCAMPE